MTHNYTDYLGNPVSVGDTIVYPVQQGSSAANLTTGEIIAIEDIIPRNPSDPYCTEGYLDRDRDKQFPPIRRIAGCWDLDRFKMRRLDDKAYILKVRRLDKEHGNKQVTVKNVDRVVVVTSLIPAGTASIGCTECGSYSGHLAGCTQLASDGGFGYDRG